MAIPTIKDVQAVDPVMTHLLIGYMQAETRFVALRAFPGVEVDKDSGTYYKFDKKYWFLDEMKQRAPGEQYARGGFGVSTDTFATLQWALSVPLADEVRANSQIPMDLESAAVHWLAIQSLIRKERAFAAEFMTTGVWGTLTVSNKWSDYTNGDPFGDITKGKRSVSNATGYVPNTLVIGGIVHDRLINHPDLIDRVKYVREATEANIVGAIAAAFGISNYLVSQASYNTANEGQAFSGAAIIDDDALLIYVAPAPNLFGPSAGYTFYWQPGGGLGGIRPPVYLEDSDAVLIKLKEQWDMKAVATDLGVFAADVVD